ncbi:hydroxymethylbilane synthase [Buchnera aphidicola (Thelaxes californica)]|uniref:Porphobilinogen deaminase n=1 Tax=Buchnera aphidicola (Thelaxes californica) TaxID=1315998 RepID=A0A4D6YFR2_9GAMM|nr:hydroxymethylbilane synthase [Buchnera aphidicola]QCI26973.1 hydroxymethylbilane synthase [Buchnera aphidicola (Thelaxes californica)]
MFKQILKIATRNSPLALIQARYVQQKLYSIYPFLRTELIPIQTHETSTIINKWKHYSSKGIFIKALEIALLEYKADIAIHSVKDIPIINMSKNLQLSAILKRGNPLDALISNVYNKLSELPKNALIGTSSLRRKSQLLNYRNDFIIKPIYGNIETRLKKLDEGKYDAIILSTEGMKRLKLQKRIKEIIPLEISLPSCGQGAIGIQSRKKDQKINALLKQINDKNSFLRVQAERFLCLYLNASCHSPIGSYATFKDNQIILMGLVGTIDGKTIIRRQKLGNHIDIKKISFDLAKELLQNGAKNILHAI